MVVIIVLKIFNKIIFFKYSTESMTIQILFFLIFFLSNQDKIKNIIIKNNLKQGVDILVQYKKSKLWKSDTSIECPQYEDSRRKFNFLGSINVSLEKYCLVAS